MTTVLASGTIPPATKGKRLFVVDDDPLFRLAITELLEAAGYEVEGAGSAGEALPQLRQHPPDLLLLDVGLPDIGGMALCQVVRVQVGNVPIIFLTAHRSRHELLAGFAAGADDYVTKPCEHEELLARVRAVLQRTSTGSSAPGEVVTIGEVMLDAARHEVLVRGVPVALSPKEFALLWLLAVNAGRVVPRPLIIDSVWGTDFYGDPKALDVYIRLLRRKIEVDPDHPLLIETVRGVGYCFAAPATRTPPEGGRWLAAGG
jgi:DNA-binding response OmpR family regulator